LYCSNFAVSLYFAVCSYTLLKQYCSRIDLYSTTNERSTLTLANNQVFVYGTKNSAVHISNAANTIKIGFVHFLLAECTNPKRIVLFSLSGCIKTNRIALFATADGAKNYFIFSFYLKKPNDL